MVFNKKPYTIHCNTNKAYNTVREACEYLPCERLENISDNKSFQELFEEISDDFTPIYTYELFDSCADLDEYVAECFADGLLPTGGDMSLSSILTPAYYLLILHELTENKEEVFYNLALSIVEDWNEEGIKDFAKILATEESIKNLLEGVEGIAGTLELDDTIDTMKDYLAELIRELDEDSEATN